MSLTMVTMVHYHVFAEPFVLVVIRGAALDMANEYNLKLRLLTSRWLELHVVGTSLLTATLELHVVGTSPPTAALELHVVRTSLLTAALSTRVTKQVMQDTYSKEFEKGGWDWREGGYRRSYAEEKKKHRSDEKFAVCDMGICLCFFFRKHTSSRRSSHVFSLRCHEFRGRLDA